MKFCKFFPLAVLSSVLTCSCYAGITKEVLGSSSVYKIENIDQYSVGVSTYLIGKSSLSVPNVYVLDINHPGEFDKGCIASLLLNVISNVTEENSNANENIKFLVYVPGLKNQDIIPILDNFGFKKDDDVLCGSIYRNFSKDIDGYLRLFMSRDGLKDLLNKLNQNYNVGILEIKDI
jgi:hypothetical protein